MVEWLCLYAQFNDVTAPHVFSSQLTASNDKMVGLYAKTIAESQTHY